MGLTREDVEKVSLLARLRLSESEIEAMTGKLASVLEYVEQLAELDTEDVEPMAHVAGLTNVFRADEARPSYPRERVLAGAPKADGECYLVPAVLGE